jgi:hypothetical protein
MSVGSEQGACSGSEFLRFLYARPGEPVAAPTPLLNESVSNKRTYNLVEIRAPAPTERFKQFLYTLLGVTAKCAKKLVLGDLRP